MAKKEQTLSFSDLARGLQENKLAMNPAVQAQIDAAMMAPSSGQEAIVPSKSTKSDSNFAALNSNLVKLTKVIEANTRVLDSKSKITQGKGPTNELTESDLEYQKTADYQTKLLEQIAENTKPRKDTDKAKPEEESGFKIGGILTAIALALGIAAGTFLGKLKAFMTVAKGLGAAIIQVAKFVKNLIPESIRTSILKSIRSIKLFFSDIITKLLINLEYVANLFKQFLKNRFGALFLKIQRAITAFVTFFSNVFTRITTAISNMFRAISVAITKFFSPIGKAFGVVKTYSSTIGNIVGKITSGLGRFFGFFTSIGKFFGNVVGKLGAFTKVFGAVTKIVSKLAYPITLIIGAYDGIMEGIKGFTAGGIVGGIKGFIKGAWKSIVSSFLELVKDMISWVLGAFGFDKAEKWLDSFSFEDMFDKFWDMVFKPFEMIQDFFMNLEIPKFSIPVLGEFGPYKIGGGKKDAVAKPASTSSSSVKTVASPTEANKVYSQSANNIDADKKAAKEKATTIVNAPSQVNNQTQNAFVKAPVRNTEPTLNSYLRTRMI